MPQRAPGLAPVLLVSLALACNGDVAQTTGSSFTGVQTSTAPPATDESSTGDATTGAVPTTTADDTTGDPTTTTTTDATTTTDTGSDSTSTGEPIDLCAALGGMDPAAGIPALVDDFFARLLVDDRVNGYFLNSAIDGPTIKTCLAAQLGELAACDDVAYACRSMKEAHQGHGISAVDQTDFMELLGDALTAFQQTHPDLGPAEIDALVAALAALAPDIVEDPTSDATLYQRVGRKPRLRGMIGADDKSSTFLGIVSDDTAIDGFFLGVDLVRMATCMTRQLASLDGPVVYGGEVTAPPDVEPGVALDNPCKDMTTAHVALKDDLLTPITIDDFMALMTDMTEALDNFNVAPADRDQLLGLLADMCPQIVPEQNDCPGNNITVTLTAEDLALDLKPVDGKYDGTLGSMLCVDLEAVADGVNVVDDVRLTVAMDHTWVGDITIKLVGPDAKILTVLSRTGDPNGPLPDSSEDCCGDNSNLASSAPVSFSDAALFDGGDMGKGGAMGNNNVVCADEQPEHDPCEWTPFPGMGPGVGFVDYAGKPAPGIWQVCFGDSNVGDFGAVSSVSLALDKVKDPP